MDPDSNDPENEWDSYAAGWDDDEAARAYAGAAYGSLSEVAENAGILLRGARVIDFGCGTGLLTEHLVDAHISVVAVDTSPAMLGVLLAKIEERGWAEVDARTELPPQTRSYDVIVCSSVCGFLDDYPATVRDLVERLKPGGLFVQWDWERTEEDPHGLSRDEILETLASAELEEITVDTAFEIPIDGYTMSPLIGHGRAPVA